MTAVAPPLSFQPASASTSRPAWTSAAQSGMGSMSSEDMSRMFMPGPRKGVSRSNSSSTITSTASSNTVAASGPASASAGQANGTTQPQADSWATRKKPNRGIWPTGKSEPTAGLSTTRPQPVSSTSSGPSAASAISALHAAPMTASQQMTNGQQNASSLLRNGQGQPEAPALLYLSPMNGTFEKKSINVPYYPDVLKIGRQTNAKSAPTPVNGFFDSKVLSRQHAEVYAERSGRIYIRDVKSSNGTFVNGQRLSPENKESEPHEVREQDVLELGIDIVSEDQKTVVHHKVAARVEHAGIYTQGTADINFGDLDPSSGNNLFSSAQQMKRNGSQTSVQSAKANAMAAAMAAKEGNQMQQQGWSRTWLQPISTEQIVKRLNRELTLARQQSQDIARAQTTIEGMLGGDAEADDKENQSGAGKPVSVKPSSPVKSRTDNKPLFSEPPAPPPQQPLPEKPDVAKALADPMIQPLLQRSDTAKPRLSFNGSPTRGDHSQALLVLTRELRLAKDQIPSLEDRVKNLEQQLLLERTARESAEERALRLESNLRKDSAANSEDGERPDKDSNGDADLAKEPMSLTHANQNTSEPSLDLQTQLDRLHASMDNMKQQMEAYRQRAEIAEAERNEARQTLADMVEEKRRRNAEEAEAARRTSQQPKAAEAAADASTTVVTAPVNGHATAPHADDKSAVMALLRDAGVIPTEPVTHEQAAALHKLLKQDLLLRSGDKLASDQQWAQLSYHGLPHAAALSTVVLGLALMHYLNGWEKMQR